MKFFQSLLGIGMFTLFTMGVAHAQEEAVSVSDSVNSSASEQNPVLSPDGQVLYFTRQHHPDNAGGKKDGGDIWYSTLQSDNTWSAAKNMGRPLNNAQVNSIIGFADNGQTLLLQGHYLSGGKQPNTQGISITKKTAQGWSDPQPLQIPYYYNKSDHNSGTLHTGGNIMIVALQSYDSRGAEDLYVLFRQADGSWTSPKNLGKDINTEYQEMTPFLAPDGKTLFFASNGYEGFGSRDIFMSVRLDDSWKRWSNPKNLGASVNTAGTELYYFLPEEGDFAYLTSTQNSDGLGDIKRVRIRPETLQVREATDSLPVAPVLVTEEIPEETAVPEVKKMRIQGVVRNKETQQPVPSRIAYQVLQDDGLSTREEIQTDREGNFSLLLEPGNNYELSVRADGFISQKDRVLLSEDSLNQAVPRDFLLTPIEVGATVNLQDVLFDRGTAEMLPGSTENLDEVVTFLKENASVYIEVKGHTDNQGRADLNMALSKERAKVVKDYLVSQGIETERISDKGYGGTQPIASNAIEEERKKNRRVEFTIVKK